MGAASQRFAGSGRVGSGSYAGALGDAATGVAAQMYNTERNRQTDVLSMLPQLTGAQYADAARANGYDAEDVDREIAADNQRADDLGLIFDSDPRYTSKDGGSSEPNRSANAPDITGSQSLP